MLRYLAHPFQLAGVFVAIAVGLLGHNLAQVYAGRLLGDHGPARAGFGHPAPRRHLEPLGVVAALLAYHGWCFPRPVPVQARFRRQRARAAGALLTGPLVLFALTVAWVAAYRAGTQPRVLEVAAAGAETTAGLLVVSLLPVPPLTGGRLAFLYAPTTAGWQRARYQLFETPAGPLIALGILLLPVVFPLLPNVVAELADPVLTGVRHLVGVP